MTDAFAGDAIVRYVLADDETYARTAGLFFGHYFDVRLAGGEVFVTADGAGASLWNPPGGNRLGPDVLEARWRENVVPGLAAGEVERYQSFAAVLDAMTPAEPHWYLGLLGTAPAQQGTGVGTTLLRPMLSRADRERVPVFLETGMDRNVAFYERFGFAVAAADEVPGGPRVWGMLRSPR